MKRSLALIGPVALVLLCPLSMTGVGVTEEPVGGERIRYPAKPIFNGRDLSGWKEVGGGKWSVQDGTIVGETGDGRYGWLVTEREYAYFTLYLKFKAEAPGNSGVQFRSHVIDGQMQGYQADVDPGPGGSTGSVWDEHRRNRWLAVCSEEGKNAYKPGEWNEY